MVGFDENNHIKKYKNTIAGIFSGFVTRALFQPLDVVKIKFQLQVEPITKNTGYSSKYTSFYQAFKTIGKEEGFRGLWAGHNPGQILSMIYGGVNFTTFEILTQHFGRERTGFSHFACGSISGGLATIVSYPFDIIRTRFVAEGRMLKTQQMYKSMLDGLFLMLKKEGITSPFKGLSPALIQAVPLSGLTFLTHNLVTKLMYKYKLLSSGNTLSITGNLIAGGVSGFVAKTCMYPLDFARKRMQLQGFQHARKHYGKNFYCAGLYDCVKKTWLSEGFLALFKGWVPSVIKAALTTASYFTVYNQTCKYLS